MTRRGSTVPFALVDVFASVPLTGNPVSIVPDADDLTEAQMQAIAREFNQSETVFVLRPDRPEATWRLRSFTPIGAEVSGAGHNALGTWLWLAVSRAAHAGLSWARRCTRDLWFLLPRAAMTFARARRWSYSARMERYVIRGGKRGYERLQVLARSWLPTTSALLDRVRLGPGMSCLDLGCGGGDVTFELARRVGPGGRAVGVDMDEVKIGLARQAAMAQGLPGAEFRVMNVYAWAEPDTYDLVYCRNLLQHLSRPVEVLRTMWEAVREGGVIVVEDADFEGSFCDPPNEGFAFWVEAYQRVLERHGGDPLAGRKLHRHFPEAGIPAPELSVVQRADVGGEAKTLPYSTVEATAEAIISEGIASADQLRAALDSLNEFAADPASVCGSPRLFQAWSRRPVA